MLLAQACWLQEREHYFVPHPLDLREIRTAQNVLELDAVIKKTY
jgi:hypothetical protein